MAIARISWVKNAKSEKALAELVQLLARQLAAEHRHTASPARPTTEKASSS
ncbi:hypothetical protein [Sphingomonas parapaucimobilis]|uniref:hypothetical protein n=1 Tax=Sphingomonas parapaucimobilis TaxID=28213 RepID=UPI00321926EB